MMTEGVEVLLMCWQETIQDEECQLVIRGVIVVIYELLQCSYIQLQRAYKIFSICKLVTQ